MGTRLNAELAGCGSVTRRRGVSTRLNAELAGCGSVTRRRGVRTRPIAELAGCGSVTRAAGHVHQAERRAGGMRERHQGGGACAPGRSPS